MWWLEKKPGAPLRGRCDSFVVETDVHYPTDVNLLWDAMPCMIRKTGLAACRHDVRGWCQWKHLEKSVRRLFQKVRLTRRAPPQHVASYLELCRKLVLRVENSLFVLEANGASVETVGEIRGLLVNARRQIDQTDRRLLKDETIPQEEKVFSILEPHTRWKSKGKAGCPEELRVPI